MSIEIRIARDRSELLACRRFWYSVYVEEMGRHRHDSHVTCHESRTLRDEFDESGNLFVAWDDGKVMGSVLNTYADHHDFGYYNHLYRLQRVDRDLLRSASLTNKLIVAKTKRKGTLSARLAIVTYRQALLDGVTRTFIDCNAHLVDFFTQIGFVEHEGWVIHKDYGSVYSMYLDLFDRAHLVGSDSLFLKHFDEIQRARPNSSDGAYSCRI